MIPDRVRPGASFTAYSDFFDPNGKPLTVTEAVGFAIRDRNKNLIQSGIAEQTNKAERWQSEITLPEGIGAGEYNITWIGKAAQQIHVNSEAFTIADTSPNFYELDLLLPERSIVTDSLKVESYETVTNLTTNIITPEGEIIFTDTDTNPTPIISGNNKFYSFNSAVPVVNLLAGTSVFALYIIEWVFLLDGAQQREHHFVYVVNHKTLAYVNELRRMIDKAAIQNPNTNLRYNNVDLVAYLNQGLQYINAQPPTQTAFTLTNIPNSLYIYVLYAAAIAALESRYLAEAEAAFNFSGQPITLEVDRTGFIESAIGRYQTKLDALTAIKKGIVMSGSTGVGSAGGNSQGVLSLSIGPTLTLSPFGNNSRSPMYYGILDNLGYTV